MTDDDFLAAFEDCTLPRTEWTHFAHLRMAWLYLTRLSFGEALRRVRNGIRRYNASAGSDGYHETVTVAFVALVGSRLTAGEDFAGFRAGNPDLFTRSPAILERHYSPAALSSTAARQRFVRPDREPLPIPPLARVRRLLGQQGDDQERGQLGGE
jgi:hypothetical protein